MPSPSPSPTATAPVAEALLQQAREHWQRGELSQVHPPALQAATLAEQLALHGLRVQALNLATLTLSELGLAERAAPLAMAALELAQTQGLHDLLPSALSCAAHVHARRGDLAQSEPMHMQALSLARESGRPDLLQQAYCNLLVSLHHAHEELSARHGPTAAALVLAHAQRYLPHATSLLADQRLDDGRRANLALGLGHLQMLCGQTELAHELLDEAARLCERLRLSYLLMSVRQSQAELRLRMGQAAEALRFLQEPLAVPTREGGYGLRVSTLRTLVGCCRALGDAQQLAQAEQALGDCLRSQAALRDQAAATLEPA